jgi:head-tail adaptor
MAGLSKLLSDIGAMDQLISIRQYTRVADATGGWIDTASYLAENIWAKIEYTSLSNEGTRGEDQQIVAWNVVKFTFRDFWTITETMRIVFDSDEYDIKSITRIGRSRFVVIEAEKRDNLT